MELNFSIKKLGECRISSPIKYSTRHKGLEIHYVNDKEYILNEIQADPAEDCVPFTNKTILEKAGPREKIFFAPNTVHAGIVTCGGLCPGLNTVIRSITNCLWYHYEVKNITGYRYGYKGLIKQYGYQPIKLTPETTEDIHHHGGTILGSSRGGGDRIRDIVDYLTEQQINMIFTIGGDGTQNGALMISEEIERRGLQIAVVGVPKTIDNDLSFVQKSFGFESAVSVAVESVAAAHVEARAAMNGIGLVKLMGRQSGFIAAHTALASGEVNYVLVPEVPFDLEGTTGLMATLESRLKSRQHAVIVVAEGAGQDLMPPATEKDESGNIRLNDIGIFLKEKIEKHFKDRMPISLKYIDPSYIIRSAAANPIDIIYCDRLGMNAAHAAMSGRTGMLISLVNNFYVHVPITMATSRRNTIDPEGSLWRDVIETTGQPVALKN